MLDQVEHVLSVVFVRQLVVLSENLPSDHIVLGQSAGLVRDQELDSAELFRDVRVTGDDTWDLVVVVDAVAVPELGEVEVDSDGDRDDTGHEKHDPEEEHLPVAMEAVQSSDQE